MFYQKANLVCQTGRLFHQDVHIGLVQLFGRSHVDYVERGAKRVYEIEKLNEQLANFVKFLVLVQIGIARLKTNNGQ